MDINFDNLDEGLQSTYKMLISAFPNKICTEDYYPLLALLYNHMADENLAKVVSKVADLPFSVVYNDMLKSVTVQKPSSDELERVKNILLQFGFEQWENEE